MTGARSIEAIGGPVPLDDFRAARIRRYSRCNERSLQLGLLVLRHKLLAMQSRRLKRKRETWRLPMNRYVIERELPGVGSMNGPELAKAAAKSNGALAELNGKVQWIQSYVADNKTFCVYLAESEAAVNEHARVSGFPANKITEIATIIDPMTARQGR